MKAIETLKIVSPGNDSRGFTLLELLIAISIVAILTSIALPNYLKQTQRARRSSATTDLMNTAVALQKCFTLNVTYVNPPCTTVPDTHNTSDGYYAVAITNRAQTTFLITATPISTGLQKNDVCQKFTLDSGGTKGYTSSDPNTTCW